jgi:hypothetical protein
MSIDAVLCDPVTMAPLLLPEPHFMRGGTYCLGGEPTAALNVTYNYAPHYYRVLGEGGLRGFDGKSAAETIPLLAAGAAALGDDVDPDYWKPTEGNCKRALLQLLALAQMRPDGIWRMS